MNIYFENYEKPVTSYDRFLSFIKLDLAKEILKIRYQIYILMKKVIILRKIQVTMKPFAPPFIKRFSLNLKRKEHNFFY